MFTRCTFCHRELPGNETLEHFGVGRRVAFDPARGRLWAVCPACRRWNLAPIEERWETLEELEKLSRDRGRLLSQTDNIALLRAGELEIVQVGRANLTEEAWWRYGVELVRRRRRYQMLTGAAAAGVAGLIVSGTAGAGAGLVGGWWAVWGGARALPRLSRKLYFGTIAWRGRAVCPRCGTNMRRVPFSVSGALVPRQEGEEGLSMTLRCLECEYGPPSTRIGPMDVLAYVGSRGAAMLGMLGLSGGSAGRGHWKGPGQVDAGPPPEPRVLAPAAGAGGSGFVIAGVEGEHLLRRVLAYQNFAGAKLEQLRQATSLIESAGSAQSLTRRLAEAGRPLSSFDATQAIALEIAASESLERRLLELELAQLETRWRAEEELAAIVDGELTLDPGAPGP